jgi:hypothetical protein
MSEDDICGYGKKKPIIDERLRPPTDGMPNPTKEDARSAMFTAIWMAIMTWDINVPAYYDGYCAANGSHVKLILDAINTRHREDWDETDSNLCQHAKRELELAGLFDEDSDYGGMLGRFAYEIVRTFASQGHSGASAEIVVDLVARLMRYQPLTPITTNPDEWIDQSEVSGTPLWQSKRDPSLFSTDGGKTWQSVHTHTIP